MESNNLLGSERLLFKRIEATDFHLLNCFFTDSELTKYLPSGEPLSEEEIKEYLEKRLDHWEKHPFGTYILSQKSTGEDIGYCGIESITDTDYIDIRYGIFQKFWGKGLAVEASKRIIKFGLHKLKLPVIYGVSKHKNIASIKVLEKSGMQPCEGADFYGDEVIYYYIQLSLMV